MELEELFVNTAELLAAEVLVVHGAAAVFVDDVGKAADGREEGGVGEGRGAEEADRGVAPEVAAETEQAERGGARAAEGRHHELERFVEVAMAVAAGGASEGLQAGGRVVLLVEVASPAGGGGIEEQIAALGDEEEEEAIDEPEELAVVVLARELAGGEGRAEIVVGRMGEKAAAQGFDRLLDARGKLAEHAGAHGGPFDMPLLDDALVGLAVGRHVKTRCVEREPEKPKIGERLALEDGFEVKLHERLPRHAHVVADEPELAAVGDDAPEGALVAIEPFLDERMGGGAGRAGDARGAAVERHVHADQVDRHVVPLVGDRERLAGLVGAGAVVERAGGGRGGERAVAKLLEEKPEPLFERGSGGGVEERGGGELVGEGPVDVGEPGPGAGDRLAEPLAGREAVIGRPQTGEFWILGGDALEHVGGQHRPSCDDVLKREGAAAADGRTTQDCGGHGGRAYPAWRGMARGCVGGAEASAGRVAGGGRRPQASDPVDGCRASWSATNWTRSIGRGLPAAMACHPFSINVCCR